MSLALFKFKGKSARYTTDVVTSTKNKVPII